MKRREGYYGIVQYFPEPDLHEGANVGVYLLTEGVGVRLMMSQTNARVKRLFGSAAYDDGLLSADKAALRARIEARSLTTLDELERFIACEAGHIMLTTPHPIAVTDVEADLRQLYSALVPGSNVRPRPKAVVPPDISRYFEPLFLNVPIQKDVHVEVPRLNKRLVVPYAYLNLAMNYIMPRGFSGDVRGAVQAAEHIGVQGLMLSRHPTTINGEVVEQKLVIVAGFPDGDVEQKVTSLLSDFPVRTVPMNQVQSFAEEVRDHARLPGLRSVVPKVTPALKPIEPRQSEQAIVIGGNTRDRAKS